MRPLAVSALVVLLLDQASKYLVVEVMALDRRLAIEVAPPVLSFRMAWNTGINFGLLPSAPWLLIAMALAISAAVTVWVLRSRQGGRALVAAGLVVGGAVGNVIDRLRYGAVADFLNVSCCGVDNPFAFNLADTAIFLGAAGLILFATAGEKTP